MIGFSPYVRASNAGWESGLTIVYCYECKSLSAVIDNPTRRTYTCSRLPLHDLLEQAEHLRTFESDENDDTDSA